jgi:hypothetical protein
VLLAAAGLSRLRSGAWRAIALTLFVLLALGGAREELYMTSNQLPHTITELADVGLPAGASVRLDVEEGRQLWVAYFLARQPLCSESPLMGTSYPHVPVSRRADYVLREREFGPSAAARGGSAASAARCARAGTPCCRG